MSPFYDRRDTFQKRDTGISIIGETEWGTNICLFYETLDDLLKPTASFFKAGLEKHERCLWSVTDPITPDIAIEALRDEIPHIDAHLQSGAMAVTNTEKWDVGPEDFNLQRITAEWSEALSEAESLGYAGLRISGNASWLTGGHWSESCQYEQELERTVAGRKMIVLCTHSLSAKREIDLDGDIVRGHHFTVFCRKGNWEFPETQEVIQADAQVDCMTNQLAKVVDSMTAFTELTPREKVVLAQIVSGASSKEIASMLGISPRTVEFHRANIMSKMDAKNVADLVRIMSGNYGRISKIQLAMDSGR